MHPLLRPRLFAAALCLVAALPSAASEQHAPTVGEQREAVLFWPQAQREADFRRMYELFPSDRAEHGAQVRDLPKGRPLQLDGQGGPALLASYMEQHHLAGVMVLQHGRVRLQRYALGFGPEQRWESFSVAKSVTSTLLGIALQRGDIHGMDDTLDTYIPELRDSAYAKVTVQQLLTMTSGLEIGRGADVSPRLRRWSGACAVVSAQAAAAMAGWLPLELQHGRNRLARYPGAAGHASVAGRLPLTDDLEAVWHGFGCVLDQG